MQSYTGGNLKQEVGWEPQLSSMAGVIPGMQRDHFAYRRLSNCRRNIVDPLLHSPKKLPNSFQLRWLLKEFGFGSAVISE